MRIGQQDRNSSKRKINSLVTVHLDVSKLASALLFGCSDLAATCSHRTSEHKYRALKVIDIRQSLDYNVNKWEHSTLEDIIMKKISLPACS